MGCGIGCRCGSDPTFLWLWFRLAAAALIRPLAWELSYAMGVALKRQKKQTKKDPRELSPFHVRSWREGSGPLQAGKSPHQKPNQIGWHLDLGLLLLLPLLGLNPRHMEVPWLGVESELHLPPTPQLGATLDPSPTE